MENFEKKNPGFPKFSSKIDVFQNFDHNRDFSKILTKIEIFRKF